MRTLLLFFFLSCCSGTILAGQSIVLEFKDLTSGEPIPYASVLYVFFSQEGESRGYVYTDADGRAVLPLSGSPDSLRIEVFQLSYEPLVKVFSPTQWSLKLIDVLLSPRIHQIQEVRVKGESLYSDPLPDTSSYIVDSIATLSTPGIIDVLERIDGVRISGNRITYHGESVSRVFLDGIDLTSDSYMTLVEAVNTTLIEQINFVSNFHANPVLEDFEASQLVLDLRTRSGEGMQFSGRGVAGLSDRELLTLSADVTAVSQQIKSIVRITNNRRSNGLYLPSDEFSTYNPLRLPMGQVTRNYETRVDFAPLESTDYTFDQKILGTAILLGFAPANNWTVRSSSYLQRAELTNSHSLTNLNILPDTTFMFGYENQTRSEQYFFRTELETEYKTRNEYLNIQLAADLPWQTSGFNSFYTGQLRDTMANVLKLRDAWNISPSFNYARRLGTTALDFKQSNQITAFTEKWENANERTSLLRGKSGFFTDEIRTRQFLSSGELLLRKNLPGHRAAAGVGYQHLSNQKELSTFVGGQDFERTGNADADLRTSTLYATIMAERSKQHAPLEYSGKVRVGISAIKWQLPELTYNRSQRLYLGAEFGINKKFNRWSGMVLSYYFENKPISPRYVMPDSILTPNYWFIRAYNGRGTVSSHQLNLNYTNDRVDRLFNYNLSLNLIYRPNAVMSDLQYFLSHQIVTYQPHASFNQMLNFNWSQDFIDFNWGLSGQMRYSSNIFSRNVNLQEVISNFSNYSKQLKATYRKGGVEFILSGELRYLQISTDPGFQKSDSWYWTGIAEFNYLTRKEHLRFGVVGEYLQYGDSGSHFIALDFMVDYHISNSFRLQLQGHNLLNNHNFVISRISPEFASIQSFELRPGYVGLIATFFF